MRNCLLLVMSFGGSLQKWKYEGILSREIELYIIYLRKDFISKLYIFTYSARDELVLEEMNLEGEIRARIVLITPTKDIKSKMGKFLHSVSMAKIRRYVGDLRGVVCKTNQISGCWTGVICFISGGVLFLRCGYLLSDRTKREKQHFRFIVASLLEIVASRAAKVISTTTSDAARQLAGWARADTKVFVAPTYVDVEKFRPLSTAEISQRVLFVGRLERQKNIVNLIKACAELHMPLTIIGDGSLRSEVVSAAGEGNVDLRHMPVVQNSMIPEIMAAHAYFVLPSLHEGLPKVLIEAMAAGMLCVGTPVPGTTDLIEDEVTGIICEGTQAGQIAEGIRRAVACSDPQRLRQAARQYVLKRHSLDYYATREFGYLSEVMAPAMGRHR